MKRECNDAYIVSLGEEMKDNPKRFWGHVNSLRETNSLPDIMFYNDLKVNGYDAIVKAFCMYFKSLFLFIEVDSLPP